MQKRAIKQKEVRQTTTSERSLYSPCYVPTYIILLVYSRVYHVQDHVNGVYTIIGMSSYYHEVLTCHYVRSYSTAAV